MKEIIFVCVSNTCRSPMAEYICRMKLQRGGLDKEYSVTSRSLSTDYEPEHSPASPQGIEVLREVYNLDLTSHRSKLLSQEDVDRAFIIIPVKRDLGEYISHEFLNSSSKIRYLVRDVPDPWHQPVHVFSVCAHNLDIMLDEQIRTLTQITNVDN